MKMKSKIVERDRRRRHRYTLIDMAERQIKVALEALTMFEKSPDHEKPSGTHDSVDGATGLLQAALGRIETVKKALP